MHFQERDYQLAAVEKSTAKIKEGKNSICVVPTAGGKSVILCGVIDNYLSENPHKDVLVLSHDSSILLQNYNKLRHYFHGIEIGLYSAGLESRTKLKITVAGIQSVYRKPELFDNVGLIVIDECHLINNEKQGMYRKFLDALTAIYFGLTATHFRTGQGYLHQGKNSLFQELAYDLSSYENYNKLLADGWLAQLIPVKPEYTMDPESHDLKKVGGDWQESDLADIYDREEITNKICKNLIKYGKKYKKWLIFAIDIHHAETIAATLNELGIPTKAIHSKIETSKTYELKKFRKGEYRAVVNVDMLTTGLDIPEIDLIAHCRPTASPVFHVQSNGRGGRPVYEIGYPINTADQRLVAMAASVKPHCLVVDFAGNTERLGPINDVKIKLPGDKKGNGEPITKVCEECGGINHPKAKECICCGTEFKFKHKLDARGSILELVKIPGKKLEVWLDVDNTYYSLHNSENKPTSFRVHYQVGIKTYSQWVQPNHKGFPRQKALAWIKNRYVGALPRPSNIHDVWECRDKFKRPTKILVNLDGEYPQIVDCKFESGDNLPTQKFGKTATRDSSGKSSKTWDNFDDDVPF